MGKSRYGEGLGKEIIKAINNGELIEPISTQMIKQFCKSKGWDVPDNYTNVYLANSSSEHHSKNFKKCFYNVGENQYVLRDEYRE